MTLPKYDSTGLYSGTEESMTCSACGTIFEVSHSEAECFAMRFRVLARPLEQEVFNLTAEVAAQAKAIVDLTRRVQQLEGAKDDGK